MKIYFGFIALLLSFCSLSYQFLMVKMIVPFVQNEVLCQSVTLGFFLLAMGLGSYVAPNLYKSGGLFGRLVKVEICISLVALFMSFMVYALQLTIQLYVSERSGFGPLGKTLVFQFFTVLLGFLTGLETPYLFYSAKSKSVDVSFNFLLAFNYLGAVISAFTTSFVFSRLFSPSAALIFIALINICVGVLMVFTEFKAWRHRILSVVTFAALVPFSSLALHSNLLLEQMFLKAFYYDFKLESFSLFDFEQHLKFSQDLQNVQRIYTPYQIIDILPAQTRFAEYLNSEWSLYLDHQPQFTKDSSSLYHETMVFGAVNLNKTKPASILILGGGDGLVARELLKFNFVRTIELVELDEVMLNLANSDSRFTDLNHYSLSDPRVSVIIDDAYKYIKLSKKKYDAVFIDFPFPVNFELSRLYSKEFYQQVERLLVEDGFIALDLPLKYRTEAADAPQMAISRTVYQSGFKNMLLFGPLNPFLFANKKDQALEFDYEEIKKDVSARTLMNLIPANEFDLDHVKKDGPINSIYKPMVFR
tara:strand:+ start:146046 stop:147641 length:1596 start_codon:yes stop_codon:yes gene_type:complete